MSSPTLSRFSHEAFDLIKDQDRQDATRAAARPYERLQNYHIVAMLLIRAEFAGKLREAASLLAGHDQINAELSDQIAEAIGLPKD